MISITKLGEINDGHTNYTVNAGIALKFTRCEVEVNTQKVNYPQDSKD